MSILTDLSKQAKDLNQELTETQRLLGTGNRLSGSPRPARGASVTDMSRIRGEIQGLGRKIDRISSDPDPFMSSLFATSPRKA